MSSAAFFPPPAKRPLAPESSGDPNPSNGTTAAAESANNNNNKRFKPQPPLVVPPGHVAFRFLCHSSRVSAFIGRAGAAIRQLQAQTSSKIRIEDALPGSEDRVIVILASSVVAKRMRLGEFVGGEEVGVSDAQEALVRVFERVLDVAAAADGVAVEALGGGSLTCRLLAETNQAGSVIGRGGSIVERIKRDSGCRLRVLKGDQLPVGVAEGDQIVEIEGGILQIKKALVAVSSCLQECQPAMKINNRPLESSSQSSLSRPIPDIVPTQSPLLLPTATRGPVNFSLDIHPSADERERERGSLADQNSEKQAIVFKVLIPSDRVGGVIGKGGSIIKALQEEAGVTINIGPSVAGCTEQLVIITSMEAPESHYSQAQHAAVMFFSRIIEAGTDKTVELGSSKPSYVTARLVISDSQVGPLLGKGGATISELRKLTGAKIHIIRGSQVPSCASDKDEVVEILGEFSNVKDALYQVTGILRDCLFPSKMISIAGPKSSSSAILDTSIAGYRTNSSSIYGTNAAVPRPTSALVQETDNQDIAQNSMPSSSMYGIDIRDIARNRMTPPSIYNSDFPTVAANHITSSLYDRDFPDVVGRGSDSLSIYKTGLDGRPWEHASNLLPHQSIAGSQSLHQHSGIIESRDYPGRDYTGISYKQGLSPPSSSLWASQVAGHNHRSYLDFDKDLAPVSGNLEFGRDRMSAIVTNTSVEILVSEDVILSLYGDRGSLARLRQISGANIAVHEPHPGVRERTLVFSGSSEQTQAAQNLLHTFIINGRL